MPIDYHRINHECPLCKNSTIFQTGKGYFCARCLTDFDSDLKIKAKESITENTVTDEQLRTGDHTEETEKKEIAQIEMLSNVIPEEIPMEDSQ